MRLHSLTTRLIGWVLGATALVSLVIFGFGYMESSQTLERSATERAEFAAEVLVKDVAGLVRGIEQATQTLGAVVRHVRPDPDQTRALLASLLDADAAIHGAGIAYAPEAFVAGTDFAAYLHRDGEEVRYLDLLKHAAEFRNRAWYRVPALTGQTTWSEPYLDLNHGGGDLVTYSIPVYEEVQGVRRLLAVVAADIGLGGLKRRILRLAESFNARLDIQMRFLVLSKEGRLIAVENIEQRLRELPRDASGVYSVPFSQRMADLGREDLRDVAERMMRGDKATEVLVPLGTETRQWIHFMPLAATGWSIGVRVDEAELRDGVDRANRRDLWLFVVNLLLVGLVIVLLARRITGPLRQLAGAAREIGRDPLAATVPEVATDDEVGDLGEALRRMQADLATYLDELRATVDAKQHLEGELAAARQIQMAMLPRLPEHGRLVDGCDVAATLVPAKAVGGDLFDLIPLADGRLMFLVGDVSDKGAAAALFMAKTVTLANLLGRERFAPAELLERLNLELCRDNDACMFVTATCGVLDPASGAVVFANAGHNPPLRCAPDNRAAYLAVPPGTALGVYEGAQYREETVELAPGETLLLYTDGVTEAADPDRELFGEARLEALPLGLFDSAHAAVEAVIIAVEAFVGEAEQADDITVLALRRTREGARVAERRMAGGVAAIAEMQAWLASTLRDAGVDDALVGELELVAEEVLANVVHHAHDDPAAAEAWLRVELDAERIRLRFSDAGPPFDPLTEAPAPDLEAPPEARAVGGLGVHMVKRLADRVAYRREAGRNVLEVEKRRGSG